MSEKEKKNLNEEINNLKMPKTEETTNGKNELLEFFLGIILLGLGLFLLSKKVMVSSSWYTWRIGGLGLSSGLVTVPLIIGIIWYFCSPKSIIPKIIITLGCVFIVYTIIMIIRIYFVTTSMYEYILIIGMAAAGAGLLLKTLFKKK